MREVSEALRALKITSPGHPREGADLGTKTGAQEKGRLEGGLSD
jgi:hypothetical protein